MPSDVRKLSNEALFHAVELCYSQLDPTKTTVAECAKAGHGDALAEIARRLKIMREFISDAANKEPDETDDDARWIERHAARATRILEAERNAD